MIRHTDARGGTARRLTAVAATLLVTATGTAAAHGGTGGGMMDGSWGMFGGAMGLWGLLWMGLVLAVPVLLVYALLGRDPGADADRPSSLLRERYARGELSAEEYERRRDQLRQTEEGR